MIVFHQVIVVLQGSTEVNVLLAQSHILQGKWRAILTQMIQMNARVGSGEDKPLYARGL